MTQRNYTSSTVIGPSTVSPQWDGWNKRTVYQSGSNTPAALRDIGIYLENDYVGRKSNEYNPLAKVGMNRTGPFNWSASISTLGGLPVVWPPTAPRPAETKVLSKLYEQWKGSEFNAGVTLGEGRESARMIANRCMQLVSAARALRRGNLGDFLRHLTGQVHRQARRKIRKRMDLNDLSGAWLEAHLGWTPMVKDIYNLAELIMLKERTNRIRASDKVFVDMQVNGNPNDWHVDTQVAFEALSIIVDFSRQPTWLEALGLKDPFPVAWEVVPFSFVVDWFLPIGQTLEAAHAVHRIPATNVVVTRFRKWHASSTVVSNPVAGLYHNGNVPKAICRGAEVNRRIYRSLKEAFGTAGMDLYPQAIKPKWDIDLWKLATASALVHQTLSSLAFSRKLGQANR